MSHALKKQNKLKLYDPIIVDKTLPSAAELVFVASLAAKRMGEGADAIDTVITNSVAEGDKQRWKVGWRGVGWVEFRALFLARNVEVTPHPTPTKEHIEVDFVPFDPVIKRTEATIQTPNGDTFKVD